MKASWIKPESKPKEPFVCNYKLQLNLDESTKLIVNISADERYSFWLDGALVGRGPHRGSPTAWYYECYHLELSAGEHTLIAQVWSLGDIAPCAQLSTQHGFILWPEEDTYLSFIATGHAPWEAQVVDGLSFLTPKDVAFTGARLEVFGERYPWGWESGSTLKLWQPANIRKAGVFSLTEQVSCTEPVLTKSQLPALTTTEYQGYKVRHVSEFIGKARELFQVPFVSEDDLPQDHDSWYALLNHGQALTISRNCKRCVLVDLETYVCAYSELTVSGGKGACISLAWAEALYLEAVPTWRNRTKGHRGEIEGKYFTTCDPDTGLAGDVYHLEGGAGRTYRSLWWECGRYLEVTIETADDPLTIESIRHLETGYPLKLESQFQASDSRLAEFIPIGFRTLRMCAHETYFDCPYYEQLMYVGDTRLQALITYTLTRDSRLPRKAIELFERSQLPNGLTTSRYPSRIRQVIPPFSLWWIGMVWDYALWRGDMVFIRERMPTVRTILEVFLRNQSQDGLARALLGWNFVDWAKGWNEGTPPDACEGYSAVVNLQILLALKYAKDLETWLDEPELATRFHRHAQSLASAIDASFWSEQHGMWADDRSHQAFSEHSQSLAILCRDYFPGDHIDSALHGLLTADCLTRCTVYFSHYKFEALRLMGHSILPYLEPWWVLQAQGFVTVPEEPEPSRSDCHAWGAHPLHHYYTSILGIRPVSPSLRTVRIAPNPGELSSVCGEMVHPDGDHISVEMEKNDQGWSCRITLPQAVSGVLSWNGVSYPLSHGLNTHQLPNEE